MKQFKNSFVVESDIDTVWKFYTDINHLQIITPKTMALQIIKSQDDVLQQGTEVWLSAKLVMKSKWHSKVTYIKPYEYLDEMITGRFKIWKHLHKFNRIDEKKTQVIDEINFELPYGLIGKLFENYTLKQLRDIFAYREKTTIEYLKFNSTNLTH